MGDTTILAINTEDTPATTIPARVATRSGSPSTADATYAYTPGMTTAGSTMAGRTTTRLYRMTGRIGIFTDKGFLIVFCLL